MLLFLLACSGGTTGTDTNTNPTTPDDSCVTDADCQDWEICGDEEECVVGDDNESLEDAEGILWEQTVTGHLQTEGDQDFYSFAADGGEWVRIDTEPKGNEDEMDTYVTLYDPIGKVHHVEDDHAWGNVDVYDTVLYTYLPVGGTWTIVVKDVNGVGATSSKYDLRLQEVSNVVEETDSFSDPGYELEVTKAGSIWAVGVLLEEDGDEDYIQLDLPWENCPVTLVGSEGERGSEATPTVELFTDEDIILFHKEGLGLEGNAFYPEVNGGQATIVASDADGEGSQDHWFFVYIEVDEQYFSYTQEIESNDSSEEATDLPLTADQNSNDRDFEWSGFWGTIGERADEDWFAFNATEAWFLQVRGETGLRGSLLVPEVEVYDANGELVEGTVDANDEFPDVWNIGPLDGGRYSVRVLSADVSDHGPEMYYTARVDVTNYTADISH